MASASQVAILALAVTIAAVFFLPIADVVSSHTNEQSVSDEEFTAELDTWVDLDESNIVEDSETVEWHNSTSDAWETLPDSDYEMDYDAGRINVSSGGDVSEGDDLRISYDHQRVTGMAATVIGFIPMFLAVVIIAVIGDYLARSV